MKDEDQPTPKPQSSSPPTQPPRGPAIANGLCSGDDDIWDPVAEEKSWREELQIMRHGADAIERKFGHSTTGFYLACVAALDAATEFVKPEFFVSRAAFIAELRRLMIEPTPPSRAFPRFVEYQGAQRRWLVSTVKKYEPVG